MTALNDRDREQLGEALQQLREELRGLLASAREGAQPVDLDAPIGRLSRMDALQQQSMAQASRRAAQRRLDQVESALQRLSRGEYGECLECGEPVGSKRLQVRPEAALCIACQAERERHD